MTRTLLLAVHLAAVAGWLGANYVQLLLAPRFDREGGAAAIAWTKQAVFLGQRWYGPIGAVLAVSGVALVLDGDWSWSSGFIWVGVTVIIVGAVAGITVFVPNDRRRVEALERGDASTAAAALRTTRTAALVDTALVLVAVLAMVDKWAA